MNWKIYLPLLFFMNVSLTWASFHQTFHNEDDKFALIHDLPKVELHAHLHGSVRHSTLQELIKGSDKEDAQYRFMLDEGDHGLADRPFDLFPVVHKLVNSIEIVKRVLHEMVEDYIAENVIYLEIRTTPRSLPDGTTAREYVKTLVSEIAAINQKQSGTIHTRLILSIDRGKKVSDGEDVLSLAKEFQYHIDLDTGMKRKVIVGIDFSGNPNGGRFDDFAKIFEDGRNIGFNITLHTAEIAELSETETDHDEIVLDDTTKILNFNPDRIGHFLHMNGDHFERLVEMNNRGKAPLIEICPSTSYYLLGLRSYADHPHIRKLISHRYPYSLNTDDSGIFSSTISREILHMYYAVDMNLHQLLESLDTSLDYTFLSMEEKSSLKTQFWDKVKLLKESSKFSTDREFQEVVESHYRALESDKIDMSSLYTM